VVAATCDQVLAEAGKAGIGYRGREARPYSRLCLPQRDFPRNDHGADFVCSRVPQEASVKTDAWAACREFGKMEIDRLTAERTG
jgi:hypothetical protein